MELVASPDLVSYRTIGSWANWSTTGDFCVLLCKMGEHMFYGVVVINEAALIKLLTRREY